ncbi:glycosyltransferase family 4 protein [Plantactinospora soyae]|uniref:Phosphatidylinositol alpha 1,6-mannosyltransferase n=1 Tax=Plantactinospora soyae TaxID=1544732 RepID=A0A927M545_9ACTN|nr:glycosyltransferase family 1 protein [Plantactinospora soyae]MBE1487137.1 phosphatidylinositol alpha 1,6-mannosyltransferase [Plantactinospora soyae]
MRIAIVTESFPPDVNGVAHSVVRVAEHLVRRGHQPMVIAPQPSSGIRDSTPALPYPVVRLPSVPMPGYPQLRIGLPGRELAAALRAHGTDVVHLASPFVLGARGVAAARSMGLPSVAVYQTDIAAYARAYRVRMTEATAWRWLRWVHNSAARTLAPSTATATALHEHGIERVWLWQRGVDSVRFHPEHRSAALRRALAPDGEVLVGYVGRLAVEKRVDLLAGVSALPGVRVVVVGDGPAAGALRRCLPGALFLGPRHGRQLARIYASLDVFAHTGPYETFGQTVQEAMASGLPVVAPAAGGPLDLVEPGRTGHLVPPDDATAFTDAVAGLAADPGRRAAYGRAGRAAVGGRTWTAIGDEVIGHYTAVLADARTTGLPRPGRLFRPRQAAA